MIKLLRREFSDSIKFAATLVGREDFVCAGKGWQPCLLLLAYLFSIKKITYNCYRVWNTNIYFVHEGKGVPYFS